MKAFFKLIVKLKWLVLLLVMGVTLFFASKLPLLTISGDYGFITWDLPASEYVLTPTEDGKEMESLPPEGRDTSYDDAKYQVVDIPISEKTRSLVDEVLEKKEKEKARNYADGFAIVITSDNLFSQEILTNISELMRRMDNYPITHTCLSPFSFVTFEKHGSRIAMVPMNPHQGYGEWTLDEVRTFRDRLLGDDMASNYLYDRKTNTVMLYYLNKTASNEDLIAMRSFLEPLREAGCTVAVTGLSTISERLMHYLVKDLVVLLSLCFVVILLTYFIFFRTFRGVMLPFSMSVLGIIWTLGWMAMSGYSLNLVTLLTPCLVLILGSSYSIHMLSEHMTHDADSEDADKNEIAIKTGTDISRTIMLAGLTTLAGFISLTFANTTAFRQFGLSIATGVFFCIILSMTYLPAMFAILPRKKANGEKKEEKPSVFTKFINRIAELSVKHGIMTLCVVIALFVLFCFAKANISYDSNYMSYFPQDDPIIQENTYFARTMGGTDPLYLTIKAPEGSKDFFLQPDALAQVYQFEEKILDECPDIVQSLSFTGYISYINRVYSGKRGIPESKGMINTMSRYVEMIKKQLDSNILDMIISPDHNEITLSMRNYDSIAGDLQTTSSVKRVVSTIEKYRYMLPEGTTSRISCAAYDLARGNDVVMADQDFTTMLSFVATFLIALVAFRSLRYSVGVMLPVACGIMANYVFMWVAGLSFDLVTVGFSSIAIGVGIDDALHFTDRYRKRRKMLPDESCEDALKHTLERAARPIIETTVSIVAGMFMLCFGSYAPIKNFGSIMCVTLISTNISTLFALPMFIQFSGQLEDSIKKLFSRKH